MLSQNSVIDAVIKKRGEREWRLMLEVEKGAWANPRAPQQLEDKLNAYASFVLDGKMREMYPHALPKDTQIVVTSVDPMPDKAVWLLEKIKLALRPNDVTLLWDAKGGAPEGGTPDPNMAKA